MMNTSAFHHAELRTAQSLTQADVSVIVPTYNRAELVEQAVRSIVGTTTSDVEIIICDDGSSDDTCARIARLQRDPAIRHHIRCLALPRSGLAARARNAGITACTRPLIAFLDSDDVWLPGKLQAQLHEFHRRPDLTLCWTNAFRVSPGTADDRPHHYHPPGSLPFEPALSDLVHSNPVITSSVVLRSSVLGSCGLFREIRGVEDWDLWYRIALCGPVRYLDRPRLKYSSDSTDRLSQTLPEAAVMKNTVQMLRRFLKESKRQLPDDNGLHQQIRSALAIHRRQELLCHLNDHRWKAIPRSLIEMLLLAPGASSRTAVRCLASLFRDHRCMQPAVAEHFNTP